MRDLKKLFDPTTDVGMTVPQMRRHEATVNDALVRLRPFSHKVLVALILNRGKLLLNRELIERVWDNPDDEPEHGVSYIQTAICDLRRYGIPIETLHGRGYRLTIKESK